MRAWQSPEIPTLSVPGPPVAVHDTATGRLVTTTPQGAARLYVCGITPYDATHLGHAATYVGFDLLNRAWRNAGHEVTYVQNVTDVDDPLLERAAKVDVDWVELAERETELFRQDMTALRVLPPAHYIGAVEAIPIIDTISGIDSTAPGKWSGGTTRSAAMSCRKSSISRAARSRQSTPTFAARSSSGSSTSVTFCT